ncbi:MarR family winged helix-turn-helix transcriptional regulator [Marinicellulosiphila megalodicopiae]|uniref:MarR family winged helix-turn-helix transcriptional regulator n=1 Tax=Marinicellulosiphila megalodicopiae TaxID=2724896 RepID=UPI003BAE65BB
MNPNNDQRLANQLCFPLYAASRLVTRLYQPLLDQYDLTYPQYVVLMILWEDDGITVGEIGSQALLNSNTLTPILKRMEKAELIDRVRDEDDERKMLIHLKNKGRELQTELACLPSQLIENIHYDVEKALQLKQLLVELVTQLDKKL